MEFEVCTWQNVFYENVLNLSQSLPVFHFKNVRKRDIRICRNVLWLYSSSMGIRQCRVHSEKKKKIYVGGKETCWIGVVFIKKILWEENNNKKEIKGAIKLKICSLWTLLAIAQKYHWNASIVQMIFVVSVRSFSVPANFIM